MDFLGCSVRHLFRQAMTSGASAGEGPVELEAFPYTSLNCIGRCVCAVLMGFGKVTCMLLVCNCFLTLYGSEFPVGGVSLLRDLFSVHILFKKWELRALGSNLAVNKQSWKTVELSFLHHDPSLYSPLPRTDGPAEPQQANQSNTVEKREPPPPVFDGSMEHKPLQLTLTSAALTSLFNFVKLIDVWYIFLKGAARPTRSVGDQSIRHLSSPFWLCPD